MLVVSSSDHDFTLFFSVNESAVILLYWSQGVFSAETHFVLGDRMGQSWYHHGSA